MRVLACSYITNKKPTFGCYYIMHIKSETIKKTETIKTYKAFKKVKN